MPVLPAVDSTTRPPGLRSPRFSASRIIHFPARSFTDWPGFMNSALPRIVQPVASDARFSLMSGVLPIAWTTSLLKIIRGLPGFPQISWERNRPGPAAQGEGREASLLFGEYNLAHVDIAGKKPSLAVSEVVFPQ